MMYSAPRRPKMNNGRIQRQQQQRSRNGNGSTKRNSPTSLPSAVQRTKHRFNETTKGTIICICLLWLCASYWVLRNLPNAADHGAHSIKQSRLRQISLNNNHNHNRNSSSSSSNNNNNRPNTNKNSLKKIRKLDPEQGKDSPYTIVHSLTTRFMLGQSGKPILARARYLLFETFCQPTIRYQTALQEASSEGRYDFSWFVLADPGLDKEILDDLRTLLSKENFPGGNAYLVLTNNPSWAADGVGVPGIDSYGAGFEEIARAVRDVSVEVLEGDTERLIRMLEDDIETKNENDGDITKPLLLIETMLDADDGINNHAIEWIQDLAVSHTQQQQKMETIEAPTLETTWWLLCGTDHIEWHNRDIYRLTDKQWNRKGGNLSSGIIGLRHAPHYCASAGFTRVGLTNERSEASQQQPLAFPRVAYSNHALATEEFEHCSEGSWDYDNNNNNNSNSKNKDKENTNKLWSKCFRRDFGDAPFALKGRTITSDSMDHMGVRTEDYRDLPWETKDEHPLLGLNGADTMWGTAETDFSIDRRAAQKATAYLREHLESIVKENSESRCAPGFPCREVADVAFKKMVKIFDRLKKQN